MYQQTAHVLVHAFAEYLVQAVTAYRRALEVRTREGMPLDWATSQNNQGITLFLLGARARKSEYFEEALTAYRSVLEVRTR